MGYLSFDVDGIQDYVFASYRPVDIHGASEWVKAVEEAGEVMRTFRSAFPEGEIIYAAGGSGLIRIPDRQGEEAARKLAELYQDKTGGTLTAVFYPAEKLNGTVFRILHMNIRRRKAEQLLDMPLSPCTTGDPQMVCQACGLRIREKTDTVGEGEVEEICEMCHRKRTKGRETKRQGRAQTLEELKDHNNRMALIYADLKGMGRKLEEWAQEGEEKLRQNSHAIWERIQRIVENIVEEHKLDGKYLDPVVGGDDLVLILPADRVIPAVERILKENEELQKTYGTAFSLAFVTAYYKFPIYLLFRYARELLHEAKNYARINNALDAVHFFRITSGMVGLPDQKRWRQMHGDAVFPSRKPYLRSDFQDLLQEARTIQNKGLPRTFLHNLYEIISSLDLEDERILNLQYFLSRHQKDLPPLWQKAVKDEEVLEKVFTPYGKNRLADLLELLEMGA